MKKSAHAYSALIQTRQFRARIKLKKCGHFNKVGRKNDIFQRERLGRQSQNNVISKYSVYRK